MRFMLAASLMIAAIGSAFAACPIILPNGTWNVGASSRFCSIYHVRSGRGSGTCNMYNFDGTFLGQEGVTVALRVDSRCVVSGSMNSVSFTGTFDPLSGLISGVSYSGLGAVNIQLPK